LNAFLGKHIGKFFLHPIFLNLHPTYFKNSKNILYSRYENPELKIIYSREVDSGFLCSEHKNPETKIKRPF